MWKTVAEISLYQAFPAQRQRPILLERVIFLCPKNPNQEWYEMGDAYGSNFWDIYPTCQVAGVGDHDTVIIDGAYGTSIRWKSFHRIWNIKSFSWKRWLAWKLLHCASSFVLIGFTLIGIGAQQNSPQYDEFGDQISAGGGGGSLIGIGILFLLLVSSAGSCLQDSCSSSSVGSSGRLKPLFFGFEGYLNLATIERSIFGGNFRSHELVYDGNQNKKRPNTHQNIVLRSTATVFRENREFSVKRPSEHAPPGAAWLNSLNRRFAVPLERVQ